MANVENGESGFQKLSFHEQRRLLIKAPFAIGAYLLTQACGNSATEGFKNPEPSTSILPEEPKIARSLLVLQPKLVEVQSPSPFDIKYFKNLIADLSKPTDKIDLNKRWNAIQSNTVAIQIPGVGLGTGIQICESGYFLTAAHILGSDDDENESLKPITNYTHIYKPQSGALIPISDFIIDSESDLAIFYAPTGKKPKKIEGLFIDPNPLEPGRKLWLIGMLLQTQASSIQASLSIRYGQVDLTPKDCFFCGGNLEHEELLAKVKGMKPYGGSSGGPIIDSKGNIVGIESGFYIDEESFGEKEFLEYTPDNYTGAKISSLSNLGRLFANKVHQLPTRR